MNLKDIAEIIKEHYKAKTPEEVVQEQVIAPIKDENVQISKEEIMNQIMKILNNCPPEERQEIIQKLTDADEISMDMLAKTAMKASVSDKISDDVAVVIAEELPDRQTEHVLQEADLAARDRWKIIDTLDDNNKKEDAICKELKLAYNAMKECEPQIQFVEKMQKIIGILWRTDKISEQLYKNVAKNCALLYHQTNGSIALYQMEQLIPIHEMIRAKIPELIEQEYKNIFEDEGENKKINLEEVKKKFFDRMIKEVHRKAVEEKQSDTTFMKYIGKLDEQETEILMESIKKYNSEISEKEMIQMLKIAIGEQEELNYTKTKKDSKLEGEDIRIIKQCIDSGLIEMLGELGEKERKEVLQVFNNSIKSRVSKEKRTKISTNVDKEKLKTMKVTPLNSIPKIKQVKTVDECR